MVLPADCDLASWRAEGDLGLKLLALGDCCCCCCCCMCKVARGEARLREAWVGCWKLGLS